jgi:copper homeostasis protein
LTLQGRSRIIEFYAPAGATQILGRNGENRLRRPNGTTKQFALEVCIDSVESAIAAQNGGATRVELCTDLLEGGLTPSAGLIQVVREKISVGLYVMIRPRPGDFLYSPEELRVMQRDIQVAKELNADGVVFGLLDQNGNVDLKNTRNLVQLAQPLKVTFHRAFDMAADLFRALEDVVTSGAERILTSGGQKTALQGRAVIGELIQVARGRTTLVPAGGIRKGDVRRLLEYTGAQEVHVRLANMVASPMRFRNYKVAIGSTIEGEYQRFVVPEESVRGMFEAGKG